MFFKNTIPLGNFFPFRVWIFLLPEHSLAGPLGNGLNNWAGGVGEFFVLFLKETQTT